MKRIFTTLMLTAALALSFTGCKPDTSTDKTQGSFPNWEAASGSFVREESSQYNNAVLQMKYLSDNCAMFEFRLMEGSESEDIADTLVLPFVLLVDDDGVGRYESLPESKRPFQIAFDLSKDGQRVSVSHTGDLSISPDGVYDFVDAALEVSEVSATAIIDHLPTAATSLNSNNGAYTLVYPDELVADWFYPVQAVFDDSGAVLAKFLVAKDLSAVYRADDDIEPVLIFGSAQPMLDAEHMPQQDDPDEEGEWTQEPVPLVSASLEDGVNLPSGKESRLSVTMPWELPYTLTADSSDPSVAQVDEKGMVKAVSPGTAIISGTIEVDDGKKVFSIELSVGEENEAIPTEGQ